MNAEAKTGVGGGAGAPALSVYAPVSGNPDWMWKCHICGQRGPGCPNEDFAWQEAKRHLNRACPGCHPESDIARDRYRCAAHK